MTVLRSEPRVSIVTLVVTSSTLGKNSRTSWAKMNRDLILALSPILKLNRSSPKIKQLEWALKSSKYHHFLIPKPLFFPIPPTSADPYKSRRPPAGTSTPNSELVRRNSDSAPHPHFLRLDLAWCSLRARGASGEVWQPWLHLGLFRNRMRSGGRFCRLSSFGFWGRKEPSMITYWIYISVFYV